MTVSMNTPSPMITAILDGAFEQFARHGFAKSTMTDIAMAAGVSRRALYNHFRTKEDVFKALSERIRTEVHARIVTAVRDHAEPEEKLMAVVHARSGWIYDLLHKSEFAREFINEKHRISGEYARIASEEYERLVIRIMREFGLSPSQAARWARILIRSVNGILEDAESPTEAEADVTSLVRVCISGLKSPPR